MPEDIDKIEVAEVSAILDKNGDILEDFDKPKKRTVYILNTILINHF